MTESTTCPQCSGEIPVNFPPGVCPACLLKQGMSPSTLTGAAGEGSSVSDSRVSGLGRRPSWTPPTPAALAPRFPQLEIAELLGQGGMGAVYKVRQKELDRWAALKILPDEVASDPSFAERFQREARALAQLSHQHIVTVYEFGQRDGVFFLLMEFVDGVTLRQAIRVGTSGNPVSGRALAAGPVQLPAASALPLTGNAHGMAFPPHSPLAATIDAPQALAIVTQLCDALQFAHEEGIVHRDIKPENILIDKRGRVKIADFGLAKLLGKQASFPSLTGTHQIMGTPVYMAPEQMEGTKGVDHRADIFSLGVVFYELLTGELPLGRFAPPSQKYSLDVRLDEVVLRTLEKEPGRRYQQASEVKCDVETIRNKPIAAAAVSKLVKSSGSRSFAKMLFLAMSVGLGTFTGLLGIIFFMSWSERQPHASIEPPRPIDTVAQQVAAQNYVSDVQRQQLEQTRRQQLEEAARDPFEANAIVQFQPDGVKLHPQAFGTAEMTADQRITLEKILTDVHPNYLKVEADHSEFKHESGAQITTIGRFDADLTSLENDLWTAVDSQLPVSVQKLLRERLPLYADSNTPMPLVAGTDMFSPGPGGGAGMMMSSSPPAMASAMGASPMSEMAGAMSGSGFGGTNATSNLRYQQLLGWKQNRLPLQITIRARGKWRRWEIGAEGTGPPTIGPGGTVFYPKTDTVLDSGEAPELPSGLKRFWRDEASTSSVKAEDHVWATLSDPNHVAPSFTIESATQSLTEALLQMDKLRAADLTPWDEVEQLADELLAKYTAPADKGRIHWMAAHVYGQSDIRGHGADVTRHAKEALKYERNAVQRGWLYMYLGDAAGLDAKSKDEATRWYLKGYFELLAYNLPDKAPELPLVGKFRGERTGPFIDGIDPPESIVHEVLQAAELKARKDAELVRDLVSRRNIHIQQLQNLWGRDYVEGSDAEKGLKKLATEVLREDATVMELIHAVWPQSDPLRKLPDGVQST